MSGLIPSVAVSGRGARRLHGGHPWVFRDDVTQADAHENGDLVRVVGPSARPLGFAWISTRSRIALRLVTSEDALPDRAFWAARLERARGWRERHVTGDTAFRLVFGESDGFPGLVVDRYGEHLVVQALTAGVERWLRSDGLSLLESLGCRSILARNDVGVRRLEGLDPAIEQLRGETPDRIEVREGPLVYEVRPWTGQKTGAFLDQRENRTRLGAQTTGEALDVFCHLGLFALHAARAGAVVEAVDSSAEALDGGRLAARRNGLEGVRFTQAKAFDDLRRREREGREYDTVVLDPPAFAKSRRDLQAAERAYKEVNLRAMRLLRPGGMLITSSCSYNLSEPAFMEILRSAAADCRRAFRLVDRRTQAADHPVRLGFQESHYLKCLVLNRIE